MNEAGLNAKWLRQDLTNAERRSSPKTCSTTCANDFPTIRKSTAICTTWRRPRPNRPPTGLAKHDKDRSPTSSPPTTDGAPTTPTAPTCPWAITADIFDALDVQDELQTLYTSGTVFHAFLGEKLPDWKAAATLVSTIAENLHPPLLHPRPPIPSASITGTWRADRHLPGVRRRTEVYSRITGYYRPVQNWNDGKTQEFKDRKLYDIGNSHLKEGHKPAANTVTVPQKPAAGNGARVLLFTTSTCPKCKVAGAMLDSAALPFEKIVADQSGNEELARAYGISQAPTLVVQNGDEVEKYSDVAAIKRYIDAAKGGQ